jgi:hypothetical protein
VVWQLIFMVIGSAVSPPERQAALMPTGISSQKRQAGRCSRPDRQSTVLVMETLISKIGMMPATQPLPD